MTPTDDTLSATDVLALGQRLRVAAEHAGRARTILDQIERDGDRVAALFGATLGLAVESLQRALDTLIAYDRALLDRLAVIEGVVQRTASPNHDPEPTPGADAACAQDLEKAP